MLDHSPLLPRIDRGVYQVSRGFLDLCRHLVLSEDDISVPDELLNQSQRRPSVKGTPEAWTLISRNNEGAPAATELLTSPCESSRGRLDKSGAA